MTLGQLLKTAREDLDMTQTQVARDVGIMRQSLAGYENDARLPNIRNAVKLASVLEIDVTKMCRVVGEEQ